jgi:murein hydrolase activator
MTRRGKLRGLRAPGRRSCQRSYGVIVALILLCTAAGAAWSQGTRGGSSSEFDKQIEQQEKKLQDLRDEIQRLKTRDRELGRTEKSTADKLRELERESALRADLLRELERKQERVTEQLAGIRAEHERATELLAERKRRLARTLRAMYVRGAPSSAEIVLRAESIRYALSHFKYLELLARNNERLLREIHEQEQYLAATDARLTESLFELQQNAEETRTEREQLAQVRRGRQAVLRRVRAQRAEYQAALTDLTEAEKKVQSVIAALEERRRAAEAAGSQIDVFPDIGFAKMRGSMPWPVRGHVAMGFGQHKHPKHGTVTFNSGINIEAPEGTPVRCVARGRVEYVDWLDGYGRTVIVNHGGGYYTVYAHLQENMVTTGEGVEPGGLIGRVGDSGSLEGTQLHFEVWSKSEPVDPRTWLGR